MDDRKMISEIAKGNEKAFETAVDRYARLLWKTASCILVNASSACEVEECVADVFIYLWQHPEKYDPDRGKLSSWLVMVARSRALDRFRRLMREREIPTEDIPVKELSFGDFGAAEDGRAEKLRACLDELDGEEREILIRRFFYEQKNREIAAAMGLKPKQVENRIYHAKAKLKKKMEEA